MKIIEDEYGSPIVDYSFKPSQQSMGFNYPCPRCDGKRTYYSCGVNCWVCMDCRLAFDLVEATPCCLVYPDTIYPPVEAIQ